MAATSPRWPLERGRRLARLLLGTALLLGLHGWATAAQLVLAISDAPLFAPMQLAAQEGYFAAEGLDVRVQPCIIGRRCLKHLTDGEANVAAVADTPMVFSLHAGNRFEIVATFTTSSKDTMLVARADRGIGTAADLAGKRIGIVRGTSAHYFSNVFLLVNGIPRESVKLVFIDPNRGAEPLLLGEVDAAALYRPVGPQAVKELGKQARVLATLQPYTVMANLVAQPGLSQDTLLRLLRAVQRAVALLNDQPAQAHARLAALWKQDTATVAAQLAGYDFRLGLDQTLLSTLEAESRWAVREGLVETPKVPDYLDLMRVEPLRMLDPRAMTVIK